MKKMRRLIPAIAMLLVSAVMLSTASFAWFTISTSTQVSGMEVTAVAGSSLLIVDAKRTNDNPITVGDFKQANGILALSKITAPLKPATYIDKDVPELDEEGAPTGGTVKYHGIQYLSNAGDVNPATGLMNDNKTANYVDVTGTGDGTYYYDYIVAIGSAGDAVTGALTATVDPTITKTLHNATTIDFLVANNKTDAPTFVARVNFYDAKNTTGKNVVDLGSRTIPLTIQEEELNDYIVIIMRVYFDGALENVQERGTTYVRNAYASTAGAAFGVTFNITPASN